MCDMLFDEYDLDDDPGNESCLICEDCKASDADWPPTDIAYRNILGRQRLCLCYHCYTDRCDAL